MNDYFIGVDAQAATAIQQQMQQAQQSGLAFMSQADIAKKQEAERAQRQRMANAVTMITVGVVIGGVVGGTAGALLWAKHRFWGAVIGSLFLGAPAGGAIGSAIAVQEAAK